MKNYLNFNTASEDIESKLSVTIFPLPDYFNRQNRAVKASRGTVAISAGYLSLYNSTFA
jgi:hypothetical protein